MNTSEDFLKGRNIKDRTIRVLTFNDKNYMLTDLMLDYAKVYAETLVKKCDLADVVGSTKDEVRKYRKQGYLSAFTGRNEFRDLAEAQFERFYDERFKDVD